MEGIAFERHLPRVMELYALARFMLQVFKGGILSSFGEGVIVLESKVLKVT